MRFVAGFLVGILLTIAVVWGVDQVHGRPGDNPVEARRMVNWDAVRADLGDASVSIHQAWTNLVGQSRSGEKKNTSTPNEAPKSGA